MSEPTRVILHRRWFANPDGSGVWVPDAVMDFDGDGSLRHIRIDCGKDVMVTRGQVPEALE